MPTFLRKENEANKTFSMYYKDAEKEAFNAALASFFSTEGYTLKEGEDSNGTYEKGNRVMRILLGAFYKYFKFKIYTEFNGAGEAKLFFVKETSGMSGGAIGVSQVKKEMARLEKALENL